MRLWALTAANTKMAVLCIVAAISPEDGGSKNLCNVGKLLTVYSNTEDRHL